MTMTAEPSEELTLIRDSISGAEARIRLFRIAFGAAASGACLSGAEVEAVLAAIYDPGKLDVTWSLSGDCVRAEAKLALLLVMCAEAAMPWGGTIRISRDDTAWHIAATADRLRIRPELWAAISDRDATVEVSPDQIQFPLAEAAATQLGRAVRLELSDTEIRAAF